MGLSKAITADLQASFGNTYDPTRTTIGGTVAQSILEGVPVLAPPLVKWTDVIAASGETIIKSRQSDNGRMYGITAVTAGFVKIVMGTFNSNTGLWTYVGKINVQLPLNPPAAVHTIRDWYIDDDNTSNIQILLHSVATGVNATHNSGLYRVYKLVLSDFTLAPPTIPTAITSDSKAVYCEQDPANLGILNTYLTASIGLGVRKATKDIWVPQGLLAGATWGIHKFNYSAAPQMTIGTSIVVTVGTPGLVNWTGHNLNNGDAFIFTGGTLPTGLSLNTVYYARNVIAGVSFEVSLLITILASVATTGSPGSATICRASGITTGAAFVLKTPLQAAVPGAPVALLNGAVEYVTPVSGHAANNGVECIFIGCAAAAILIPISEITGVAANFPNLLSVNLLGGTNEVVAPAATVVAWQSELDRFVYVTNTSKLVAKKCVNNIIEDRFGSLNADYLENISQTDLITQFGATAIVSLNIKDGWMHINASGVGQRGIISVNSGSSYKVGTSKIITRVMEVGKLLSYVGIAAAAQRSENTGNTITYYRTNVECDFSDATTGWIQLGSNGLMSALSTAGVTRIQFMIQYVIFGENSNPSQVIDLFFAFIPYLQNSLNWSGDIENSTRSTESPAKSAAILNSAYDTSVPSVMMLAYSKATGNLVAQKSTSANPTEFSYSSNGGTSWNALGTIPNVAGTRLRHDWSSPIPEDVDIVWIEG